MALYGSKKMQDKLKGHFLEILTKLSTSGVMPRSKAHATLTRLDGIKVSMLLLHHCKLGGKMLSQKLAYLMWHQLGHMK